MVQPYRTWWTDIKRLWAVAGNIDTIQVLFSWLLGPTAGSIVASLQVDAMVEAWLENPFRPLA